MSSGGWRQGKVCCTPYPSPPGYFTAVGRPYLQVLRCYASANFWDSFKATSYLWPTVWCPVPRGKGKRMRQMQVRCTEVAETDYTHS